MLGHDFDHKNHPSLEDLSRQELLDRYTHLVEEYTYFVKYIPDALIEVTVSLSNPTITFMNRMARIVFRYTEEDLENGIPLREIFASQEEYERIMRISREYLEESITKGIPYERTGTQDLWEVKMRRKDGEVFEAEAQTSTVLDEERIPRKVRALFRDITDRKILERDREKLIRELRTALENIQTLKGLLPICASCKKIRDDRGYWKELEDFLEQHSMAEFSHGICPDCMGELYPQYKRKGDPEKQDNNSLSE